MGVLGRTVDEVPLDDAAAEDVSISAAIFSRTGQLSEGLKARGVGAIVLGCAGFAPRRAALEERIGIPVIHPVQAAGALAGAAFI